MFAPGMDTMDTPSCARHVEFPLFGEVSVRDTAHYDPGILPQLSIRSEQVLDHLRTLLPLHLGSQPISQFSPALLFSICDALQHAHVDGLVERSSVSFLPSVLGILRNWRFLDPSYRHTSEAIRTLALELAGITNTRGQTSIRSDCDLASLGPPRLGVKWAGSASPGENEPPEPFQSSVLDDTQNWSSALLATNELSSESGVVHEPYQVVQLCSAKMVLSQRHHSVSGFRSGCLACCHPRVSFPTTPHAPRVPHLEQTTSFSDVQLKEYFPPLVKQPKSAGRTRKKAKRAEPRLSMHISRRSEVDENGPPLPNPMGVKPGITFPRQRTYLANISTTIPSRSSTPSASSISSATTSMKGILQPSRISNCKRENHGSTFNRRVASADLQLSAPRISPADVRPPPRAQSFSHGPVTPRGLGGATRISKLSTKQPVSPSTKLPERRLPCWSHPPTTRSITKLAASPSLCPVKRLSPNPSILDLNSSLQIRTPDAAKDRRPRSSRRQTSYGSSSTSLQPRKWKP
ncbi:hypothetical protein BS17DRAFT_162526 [Gyrodon lividus]|nr:hypothetical protein BS17DRAFT_162526 [Gyrodon lividus]